MTNAWKAAQHEPLERLEDNLWTVSGSLPRSPLRRRMTLFKLADGRVVVHSAIPLSEPAQREVEAWGEPAFIVVPNGFHRQDAPVYKARYPKAKVLCPAGAKARVSQVIAVDGTLDQLPRDAAVSCTPVRGKKQGEHVFLVNSAGRASLVFNDTVFNHPHAAGFGGFVLRVMGSSGGPRVTPFAKLVMIEDKAALRAHLLELADTPGLHRILVSHVDLITSEPAETLRRVAAGL